ncbi:IS630 family transposase, partial [Leptolyngbya sp. PL-A3]|nr:IS630 family transposase [Leptolyngbya sp. FACHB-8]MBD2152910.1 IS630 family transposase [Leptolyngbya sp. FACHB-16]MBD1911761.1 IS630 family transposase [Leptolyngbya sp. FACHB-8]MBD1914086.1 IS630 family transposase [Leptolyngbya sp. FACHB-8]MBD2152925.1 IS630 family transposase [Leptolyngbya sp. FACHB-16]
AETELSVLARQCLDRRIADEEALQREILAWEERRNTQLRTIDWQFTTDDARIELKRLYPSFQP